MHAITIAKHYFRMEDTISFRSSVSKKIFHNLFFLACATFRPSLRIAPCGLQLKLKKALRNCQGIEIFHAKGICDMCGDFQKTLEYILWRMRCCVLHFLCNKKDRPLGVLFLPASAFVLNAHDPY